MRATQASSYVVMASLLAGAAAAAGLKGGGFYAYIYSALTAAGRRLGHGPSALRVGRGEAGREPCEARHRLLRRSSASTGTPAIVVRTRAATTARRGSGPTAASTAPARVVVHRRGDTYADHQPAARRTAVNKPHTPRLRRPMSDEDDDDSRTSTTTTPRAGPRAIARAKPIHEIPELAELAELIRKGGRPLLPERVPQAPRHDHARPRRASSTSRPAARAGRRASTPRCARPPGSDRTGQSSLT